MPDEEGPCPKDVISFGPFRLFAMERLLEKDGVPVALGSRALDILLILVERATEVVSQKDLFAKVWPNLTVDEGSLRFHIAALRKALGDGRSGARYVTNVSGRGYCFVSPISRSRGKPPRVDNLPAGGAAKLPAGLARMVGRDDTVRSISEELAARRFVTIVGPGGIGKTTVAVSVSHGMLAAFGGAVHFVDFGPLSAPVLAPSVLASTLGLMINSDNPIPALLSFLRDKRTLLVFDSCEHLIETVATLAESIFREAPQVHILATSRESLRVEGEQVHRLLPLGSPPDNPNITAAEALAFAAVQLFVERAIASGARFELNDADAPIVGEICRRLDGIALALELAAGRVGAYGIRGIASLLDSQFRLLWHGRRTALPRHQTLSATLDWSYNLLPGLERVILRRLALFAGAFSLSAAQTVAAGEALESEQVVEALADLVAKSLVVADTRNAGTHYRLLDTTRAYLLTKIIESGEERVIAQRHATYYRQLLERTEKIGSMASPAFQEAETYKEHLSNVRAALEWSFSAGGDVEVGTTLAAASAPLFLELSLLSECQIWMERSIAALDSNSRGTRREMELREALALSLMFTKGNTEEVRTALVTALSLAQTLEYPYHQLRLLGGLHMFLIRSGDFRDAVALAGRFEAVAEAMADPTGMVMADVMLGFSHHLAGDQASAQVHCEAALRLWPEFENPHLIRLGSYHRVPALSPLARALWLRGYANQAINVARQALHEAATLNHTVSLCHCWSYIAAVFLWTGNWPVADEIIKNLIAHAETHSLRPYHAVGLGLKGELSLRLGDAESGTRLLNACLNTLRADRHLVLAAAFVGNMAEAMAMAGHFEEAHAIVDEAIAHGESHGLDFHTPEMLRVKGELLASGPLQRPSEAEEWFLRSLDIARVQSALAWELRTATSLARLWREHGCHDKAQKLLAPVYDRFTEGFETSDLRAAKRLLDGL